jgi:hypothetical protein
MKLALTYEDTIHELDLDRISMRESADLKAKTGLTISEWNEALREGDGVATGYAWFWACKRSGDDPDWMDMLDTINVLDIDFDVVPEPEPDEPEPEEAGPTSPTPVGSQPSPTTSLDGGPSSPDSGPDSSTSNESGI